MACACIGIYRKESLDESYRTILRQYQQFVIEDTCWFSIELEYHMKSKFTINETRQLTEIFGSIPEQEILIFGEEDRIFVAAYELINHFGGLLRINLGDPRERLSLYKGVKKEIHKIKHTSQSKFEPDYWLVDHEFIREYFAATSGGNFERFKLAPFLPSA
jgi:hypothetical protein